MRPFNLSRVWHWSRPATGVPQCGGTGILDGLTDLATEKLAQRQEASWKRSGAVSPGKVKTDFLLGPQRFGPFRR